MNVSREIVKDLLPLYVAGEACEESRVAVEEWLSVDPDLAQMAAELAEDFRPLAMRLPQGSDQVALAATKALLRRRSWLLALALVFTALPASFVFDGHGLNFLMLRDAPIMSKVSLSIALGLWIAFAQVTSRLRVTGL